MPRTPTARSCFPAGDEVEDSGFIGNALQTQPRKLTQNSGLVKCLFHRWIAAAQPVLHQMNTLHRHQRI